MIKFNLKNYLFLVVCALYSCQQYHQMEMFTCLKKLNIIQSKPEYKRLKPPLPNFIVILLPNLGVLSSQTDKIKKELEKNFGENIEIIQIKCLESLKSIDQDREEQVVEVVEKVYKEILFTLTDRLGWKSSNDAKTFLNLPMHICSYSQYKLVTSIVEASFALLFPLNINTIYVLDKVENRSTTEGNDKKNALDYTSFLNSYLNTDSGEVTGKWVKVNGLNLFQFK